MLPARDNPYAVHRVLRERYRLDEAGWTGLLERLEAQRYRAAIVGPHGSGKTTLLEDLAVRLEARGWRVVAVRLSTEHPHVGAAWMRGVSGRLGARDLVVVDGAEQLALPGWWRLRWRVRQAGGLIITTHRAGRLPVVWRCDTTPALLREVVESLGETIDEASAEALHARHQGNVREALRELYDVHAARAGPRPRSGPTWE